MKNNLLLFIFLACAIISLAQTVNCDLTLRTTIEGFNVYEHNPSGSIMYKAKLYIDADGSPRAYGPNNSGLDWTANAGSPGNWWGVVTDVNGEPIIQGAGDPYPGMYVSTTSLVNSAYPSNNPLRYTNSETVPFFVLPSALVSLGGISIGDIGYVFNTQNGQGCYAIFADGGPAGKLGEGSIYLADQLGINSNPRTGGTSLGIIDYIVFPQSGAGQGTIPTIAEINAIGASYMNSLGGIGIVGCLDNPINNPSNLQATPSVCPSDNVVFSWTNTGSNWHIDISTNSGFTNYWIKYVSAVTTYTGPAGFVDHSDGVTPLTLQSGTTYYWRIVNSNGNYTGPAFTMAVCDVTAPTTTMNNTSNWITNNFTAAFSDQDNSGGSGVDKGYYQVLNYDGQNWEGNAANGFFADNFDTLKASVWSTFTGAWNSVNGNLKQSDSTVNNTNIYAYLNQDLSDQYIYHFTVRLESSPYGTNQRRFGLHFHCDTGNVSQRGNSYFIFFRQETSKLEFYKVSNSNPVLSETVNNIVTNVGQWYDIKIVFDRINGKITVYRDNVFIGSWTDTTPLSTPGNYISFRTGHSKVSFGEIKVFRSRLNSAIISVGAAATNDIRFQNPGSTTSGAKIKSICTDVSGNLSAISYYDLNIDYTVPSAIISINDGIQNDLDTVYTTDQLSANWSNSNDANSGILNYWFCIGTNPGSADIIAWTDNGAMQNFTLTGLNLTYNQMYYVSVKAVNGAGLFSGITTSNGVFLKQAFSVPVASFSYSSLTVCAGFPVNFLSTSVYATSVNWVINGAENFTSTLINPVIHFQISGAYNVSLIAAGPGGSDTLSQNITVTVNQFPVANFNVTDTTINLPNAIAFFVNSSLYADSYFWNFGDGNNSTDANPWHIYNITGDYTITLIASNNNCGSDTIILQNYIHILTPTIINSNSAKNQVFVYPNPFTDMIILKSNEGFEKETEIQIMDISGNEVGSFILNAEKYNIDLHEIFQNIASGLYVIRITGSRIKYKFPIVKN